jgi:hypothetical protein
MIDNHVVFLIGSPRSGTTIISEMLGYHPECTTWYEPYFIWDYYYPLSDNDIRDKSELSEKECHFIRREFETYLNSSHKKYVVDKTIEHCFKIPFVHTVFPRAKWIHVIRDPRDVTASIRDEWDKRQNIVLKRNFRDFLSVTYEMLSLQPFWRNRIQALVFELKNRIKSPGTKMFNKAKWQNVAGWGPRFAGWQEALASESKMAFHALQWRKSVEAVLEGLECIEPARQITVYYENFVKTPKKTMSDICSFIGLEINSNLFPLKNVYHGSIGRWKKSLSQNELDQVMEVAQPIVDQLGYHHDLAAR